MMKEMSVVFLFKDILFRINPVLLLDKDVRISKVLESYNSFYDQNIGTVLDNDKTISLTETIQRLHNLGMIRGVNEEEYFFFIDSVNKLSEYRNKLQHYMVEVDADTIGRIIGSVIPRAIDIINATYSYIFLTYPGEFVGLNVVNIRNAFDSMYSNTDPILQIMTREYDQLVKDAINFFKNQSFSDLILSLRIVDYGEVGAPPYFPEIKSEGFLVFDVKRYNFDGVLYSGNITVTNPQFKSGSVEHQGAAEGSIDLDAILELDGRRTIKILNCEKQISVLKSLRVTIRVTLTYEAEAYMTSVHFDCERVRKASGKIWIKLELLPLGGDIGKEMLMGEFSSNIDESTSFFRFNAFVNPDGTLTSNGHLDWNINVKNNLLFMK